MPRKVSTPQFDARSKWRKSGDAALADNVAVVTGASRGIGLALVKALYLEGASVVAASRGVAGPRKSNRSPLAALRLPITEIRCDVRIEKDVAALFRFVKAKLGRLDILINNAGMAHPLRNIETLPLETWREVLDTNLTGMFLCTRAALPLMQPGAAIVNNLSVAARGVFSGEAAYCAAKHGALGFTDTLREEVRGRGIRVISLLPGPTATDIWNQFMPDAPREKMLSPETVARAVLNAIMLPDSAAMEELKIAPVGGNL
jgi:NAD(P)-dependent dehydrogenase (short-subunit alcohol dehydrogenase family)